MLTHCHSHSHSHSSLLSYFVSSTFIDRFNRLSSSPPFSSTPISITLNHSFFPQPSHPSFQILLSLSLGFVADDAATHSFSLSLSLFFYLSSFQGFLLMRLVRRCKLLLSMHRDSSPFLLGFVFCFLTQPFPFSLSYDSI